MEKKKILIADDNRHDLSALQERLEEAGFSVITADNGKDAMKLACEKKPDLIILDVFMPRMSGGLVRLSLKEDPATSEIPIVFLSCLFAEEEIAGQDIMFGDSPRFPKPCDMDKLLETIRKKIAKSPASIGGGKT